MAKRSAEKVGVLVKGVLEVLGIEQDKAVNSPIYCGEKNYRHMMEKHPDDFKKYGDRLREILDDPDFVALHPSKGSIEYIKAFERLDGIDYVMVPVCASKQGVYFARTLYILREGQIKDYKESGTLFEYVNAAPSSGTIK